MSDELTIPAHGWKPRSYQEPLWDYLKGGGKRACAVWHRRSGKDEVSLHHTACSLLERPGSVWHMLPQANQARKAIWDAVNPHTGRRRIDDAFPQQIRALTRENEMFIRLVNGSTWQVVGSDHFDHLVGSPPTGLVFSEYALSNPQAWAMLRPIIAENDGWALFISTPRGNNHFRTLYEAAAADPAWFAQRLPATDTDVFTPDTLEAERRGYIADFGPVDGDSRFRQEYLVDFDVALSGSYYGPQLQELADAGRITDVPHNRGTKVETAWDLGYSDQTAIWFLQREPLGQVRVIDYYEAASQPLEHYAQVLQQRALEDGYVYGRHLWPHDGSHRTLASKGKTLASMFHDLGFKVEVQPQSDLLAGIAAVRRFLPQCWFDATRCRQGIETLRNYRRDYDEKRAVFKPTPLHDWASHGADALRTAAVAWHGRDHAAPSGPSKPDRYDRPSRRRGGSGWAA